MLYKFLVFIVSPIFHLIFKIRVHGMENFDGDRNIILCSNHQSLLDPVILAIVFRKPVHFIAKKELFDIPVLGYIFKKLYAIPIDRESVDMTTMRNAINKVKDGNVVGIFIEGTRVQDFDINNAKPGAVLIARMSRAEILPVYIKTDYKIFKPVDVYVRPIMQIDLSNYEGSNQIKYKKQAEDILREIYDR